MVTDRINAALSPEDSAAIFEAFTLIEQKLAFLIDLTPEERRTMLKASPKGQGFVNQVLNLVTQNSDFLPRSFDVEAFRSDVVLLNALQPIALRLMQLHERFNDTMMQLSSEGYATALESYRYAKQAGKGAGLDDTLSELGKKFTRRSRQKVDPTKTT